MTTAEKIEVMQAYVDGKAIQIAYKGLNNWKDIESKPNWNWKAYDYRIKPEPTYRPYKDTDEMIADFKKRFNVNVPDYAVPLIWLKYLNVAKIIIMGFREDDISIDGCWWTMNNLYEEFTYLDGTPVGKLVE